MEKIMFGIFILSGLCHFCFSFHLPLYHFISEPKDWLAAQQHCRENYTDLATLTDDQDLQDLAGLVGYGVPYVYLGLYRDWGWSQSADDDYKEGEPVYWNWANGEPGVPSCGSMSATGEWNAKDCSSSLSFICYNGLATDISERFTLVTNPMSWLAARDHCRSLYTDLAHVRNQHENELLQTTAADQQVWIGLTRMSWMWSDGSEPSFIPWKLSQLPLAELSDCGVIEVNNNPLGMIQKSCADKLPFICYTAPRKKLLVSVKLPAVDSTVDMKDPAVVESILERVKMELGGPSDDLKVSWWKQPEKKNLRQQEKCP